MPRVDRRFRLTVGTLVLLGVLAPVAQGGLFALHLAIGGVHASADHEHELAHTLHGHPHAEETPAHSHSLAPAAAPRIDHPPAATTGLPAAVASAALLTDACLPSGRPHDHHGLARLSAAHLSPPLRL